MAKTKVGKLLPDDWTLTGMLEKEKTKRIAIDEGCEMLMIEKYKSMKGVPTKNLKLRLSMAKYLLSLIRRDVRYPLSCPEPMKKAMIMDLGTRLKDIIKELEDKP